MAGGLDEVDARVDTVVNDVCAVDLVLGLQISVESLLDVLNNWAPRVIVVNKIAESGGIDHSEAETDAILLDICADGLDRHGLGDDVVAGTSGFLGGIKGGVEKRVDESRLSESRFTFTQVNPKQFDIKHSNA